MNIFIAGDCCPVNRVLEKIHSGKDDEIWGEIIKSEITKSDYSIVNLECPIIDTDTPGYLLPTRPSLYSDESSIVALRKLGIDCVTLANNHFLDCKEQGVASTLTILRKYNFDFVGGGMSLKEAQRTLYKVIEGKTIAFINFCEHEFSIATDCCAGSAPLDMVDNYHQIKDAKEKSDFVVVIIHGGSEHYQLPSPRMKKTYHWFVDLGADVIVNHHQHCISGVETYNGKPIFYGIGNFCFDYPGLQKPLWKYGMAITLQLIENSISYKLIPFSQCAEHPGIKELSPDELADFELQIRDLSNIILNDKELSNNFENYMVSRYSEMELPLTPYSNRYLLSAYLRNLLPSFLTKKRIMPLLNHVECESHRDIFVKYLQNYLFN